MFDEIKKKIKKEAEENIEVDEDSDLPIHEKYAKEKKIKKFR